MYKKDQVSEILLKNSHFVDDKLIFWNFLETLAGNSLEVTLFLPLEP